MFPIRDNVRARHLPFVTHALIAANALVFILQLGIPEDALLGWLEAFGAVPARILHPAALDPGADFPGAYVTLLTSMFLHGGWFHLISNMWALWLFGDNVEDGLGHWRFALFYPLCGVLAMLAHVLLNPASEVPAVGASGAIGGVMGAYLLFFPRARMVVLIPVLFYPIFAEVPAAVFLVLWFISQISGGTESILFGTEGVGGVAFWAHVGGFLAGMILGRWWRRNP